METKDGLTKALKEKWTALVMIVAILTVGFTVSSKMDGLIMTDKEVTAIARTAAQEVLSEYTKIETTEAAEAVLSTLKMKNIYEPIDIENFLAEKPAGRTDLLKGLEDEEIYHDLLETYGDLAKNAKIALKS